MKIYNRIIQIFGKIKMHDLTEKVQISWESLVRYTSLYYCNSDETWEENEVVFVKNYPAQSKFNDKIFHLNTKKDQQSTIWGLLDDRELDNRIYTVPT